MKRTSIASWIRPLQRTAALFVVAAMTIAWSGCSQSSTSTSVPGAQKAAPVAAAPKTEYQKGMCYFTAFKDRYGTPASDESLKAVAATGTQWVALVVLWYQENCSSTGITPSPMNTPTDESIVHAINTIHSLGMKVMLKPHLDVLDTSGGSWRGEISCAADQWDAWFESYKNFMLHYAVMAQENNVEMFCIGTELTSVATIKEKSWREKVIQPIREVYKGPLTYAANWNEEYLNVVFWNDLDYVGIDAYFPLTKIDDPTLEEIKQGWEPWVKEMETFQAKVNKPIIFPEAGYCSALGTAKTPWEEMAGGTLSPELQARCYQALLETFWDKDWFYGIYWWRWGTSVRHGGPTNRGFTPQNKPAQDLVTQWYGKTVPPKRYDQ